MNRPSPRALPVTAALLTLTFATFLVGTNGFIIAGLLPDLARDFRVPVTDVGFAITAYAVVVALLAPTVAITLPRVPRTRLMAVGMVLVASGTAITAVAGSLEVFIGGRVVAGLGGAAIVPTAVAAASAIAVPERRARAIALVALGFTLSTAVGAPVGAAVAAVSSWRVAIAGVAVLSLVSAALIPLLVRSVPLDEPISARARFAVLARPRVVATLLVPVFTVGGFNIAYIYSSAITEPATGGSKGHLAVLLFLYGAGGIAGNVLAGRMTDRFGNRAVALGFIAVHLCALAVIPIAVGDPVVLALVFTVWGAAAFGSGIPVQHRLVELEPERSAVVLAWFSTALYVGAIIAPLVGAWAYRIGGAGFVPDAAAVTVLLAGVAFASGQLRWRRTAGDSVGGGGG